jgi:hypothetical protein
MNEETRRAERGNPRDTIINIACLSPLKKRLSFARAVNVTLLDFIRIIYPSD